MERPPLRSEDGDDLKKINLSVDAEEEAALLKSRWQAEVQVRLPSYFTGSAEIVTDARHCLAGRDPLIFLHDGVVSILFLVANANDGTRGLVDVFAKGLTNRTGGTHLDILINKISYFDTADYNHLLSEKYQPKPYSSDS